MADKDCACGPGWVVPKPNGTCNMCGGWLPGQRPKPLPFTSASRKEHNDG